MSETSLSAGRIIREILLADENVTAITSTVYPLVADESTLPYIVYRRTSLSQTPTKGGQYGADNIRVDVVCYGSSYSESVAMAEAVRGALDCVGGESGGLVLRSCYLEDAEELWDADAFVQSMTFKLSIYGEQENEN